MLDLCSNTQYQFFSPYQIGDIKKIESVQKYFTKQIFKRSFPERSRTIYLNRLALLGIQTLEMRRVRADLVMCYKIVHKEVDVDREAFFRIRQRGNNGRALSLDVPPAKYSLDCQRYSFAHQTYPIWNELKENVVLSQNAASFQRKIDQLNMRELKSCKFVF